MDSARLRRSIIALIAAYAMAPQGLLLAFVPMRPAALAAPFALCAHDAADGSDQDQTGHRDLPCAALCAAIGHGVAGPLPADAGFVVAIAARPAVAVAAGDWIAPRRLTFGPQIPRGPPLA